MKLVKFSIDNRIPYQSNFNRQNRLQNFPYNTTWKDGQPSVPPPKNNTNKVTPNPFLKYSINLVDDPELATKITWCFACQLPHSPESCAVAVSYAENHNVAEKCHEHEENNDDVGCNMFDSHYSDNEGYDRDVNDQRQYQNVMQQQVFSDESDVEDDVCNLVSSKDEVTLRKPSK